MFTPVYHGREVVHACGRSAPRRITSAVRVCVHGFGALHVDDRRSPVTVIVSSSAPTRSSAFTVAVKLAAELDAFAPDGVEAGQRERHAVDARPQVHELGTGPCSSVTTERTFSISAGLAASTVTPGSTAPDVSRTTPAIDPSPCAALMWRRGDENARSANGSGHSSHCCVPPRFSGLRACLWWRDHASRPFGRQGQKNDVDREQGAR